MQPKRPLAVVLLLIEHNGEVLLLKRNNPPYQGKWVLPGGKIELHEHILEAALREGKEETGLMLKNPAYLGVISEHLFEQEKQLHHFLLHVVKATATTKKVIEGREGMLQWFALEDLPKNAMVPTDYFIATIMKKHAPSYHAVKLVVEDDTFSFSVLDGQ